jgi:hypothetical protein
MWEYDVVKVQIEASLDATLNEQGQHGWELVCVVDGPRGDVKFAVFKRRKAEA